VTADITTGESIKWNTRQKLLERHPCILYRFVVVTHPVRS